jgi:hypothetical protein
MVKAYARVVLNSVTFAWLCDGIAVVDPAIPADLAWVGVALTQEPACTRCSESEFEARGTTGDAGLYERLALGPLANPKWMAWTASIPA